MLVCFKVRILDLYYSVSISTVYMKPQSSYIALSVRILVNYINPKEFPKYHIIVDIIKTIAK